MIKAKNYATGVLQGIRQYLQNTSRHDYQNASEDNEWLERVTNCIKHAQHFSLPDGGLLIDDKLKGLSSEHIRLPFPIITLEFDTDNSNILILVKEKSYYENKQCKELHVVYFYRLKNTPHWQPGSSMTTIELPESGTIEAEKMVIRGSTMGTMHNLYISRGLTCDNTKEIGWLKGACYTVLDFCEALSCSNVTTEVIQKENKFLNAKRIKKSKYPFSEIKTLVLKTNRHETITGGIVENRSGPKQHLRRGHIRRLSDGRKIWVNSCLVGDPSKGTIKKVYDLQH